MIKLKQLLKEESGDYITHQDILDFKSNFNGYRGERDLTAIDKDKYLEWKNTKNKNLTVRSIFMQDHPDKPRDYLQFDVWDDNRSTGSFVKNAFLDLRKYKGNKKNQLKAYFDMLKKMMDILK